MKKTVKKKKIKKKKVANTLVGILGHIYKVKNKNIVVFWVTPSNTVPSTSLGSVTVDSSAANISDDVPFQTLPSSKITANGKAITAPNLQFHDGKKATVKITTNGNVISVSI